MEETNIDESRQAVRGWLLTRERATTLVLAAATVLAFYVCYRLALPFLPALTWALALAVVAIPLHGRLLKLTGRPNLAAGLSVLVVAVLIVAPAVLLARQLVGEAGRGLEALKAQTDRGRWQAALEANPALARALDVVAPAPTCAGRPSVRWARPAPTSHPSSAARCGRWRSSSSPSSHSSTCSATAGL